MIGRPDRPDRAHRTGGTWRAPILVAVLAIGLAFILATTLLFVWPRRDAALPADAIVVFGGTGPREAMAIELAQRGLARVLVFSEADPPREPPCRLAQHLDGDWRYDSLQPKLVELAKSGTQVSCFQPSPSTTQGESEAVAQLAAKNGWHRILLVVSRPQATRARLRLRRCYSGEFRVETVPVGRRLLPKTIVYEWGALMKALIWQRQC
jgi:uncharacterized SAM-binding protein YcdF (DUF218 family)